MKAISLFSGAGGLDLGVKKAGFDIIWANEIDRDSAFTYRLNIGSHLLLESIDKAKSTFPIESAGIDLVFGGPPCQGFSVAGKMNPLDPRSNHVWTFLEIVKKISPASFLMENVKALGKFKRWKPLLNRLLDSFRGCGYHTECLVLNSRDFGVPQSRERTFIVGLKGTRANPLKLSDLVLSYQSPSPTVREVLSILDKAGTGNNKAVVKAKITIAKNPVLRKSPYSGMLFNGLGRPIDIDGYCPTLPATMGGNRTPIIDEASLYKKEKSWVEWYHKSLIEGGSPLPGNSAPPQLRRLTLREAALLQCFPFDYQFYGSQSSILRQIGNAVPPPFAIAVAKMIFNCLKYLK